MLVPNKAKISFDDCSKLPICPYFKLAQDLFG